MKDIVKIEIAPAKNGYILEAHGESKGKVITDTYACETAASLMRKLPDLLKNLKYPYHVES